MALETVVALVIDIAMQDSVHSCFQRDINSTCSACALRWTVSALVMASTVFFITLSSFNFISIKDASRDEAFVCLISSNEFFNDASCSDSWSSLIRILEQLDANSAHLCQWLT